MKHTDIFIASSGDSLPWYDCAVCKVLTKSDLKTKHFCNQINYKGVNVMIEHKNVKMYLLFSFMC